MRLKRFMVNEDDVINKGLNTEEPEAKHEYTEDEVNHYLAPIISALDALRQKGIDSEPDEAMYADLQDKKKKWEQVKPGELAGKDAAPPEPPPKEKEDKEEEPKEKEENPLPPKEKEDKEEKPKKEEK